MQTIEHHVDTPAGKLVVHHWGAERPANLFVTVHPWAPLGGGEHNTVGYGRSLTEIMPDCAVLTFNMRSSSMVWGVLTAHRSEVAQVCSVCTWAEAQFGSRLILLGSSAGAPVAGSALSKTTVAGAVFIGYTFGGITPIAFGRHFTPTLKTDKPKLFLQGSEDEFTKPTTLEAKAAKSQGCTATHIFDGVGHFELESTTWDKRVCERIQNWLHETFPLSIVGSS